MLNRVVTHIGGRILVVAALPALLIACGGSAGVDDAVPAAQDHARVALVPIDPPLPVPAPSPSISLCMPIATFAKPCVGASPSVGAASAAMPEPVASIPSPLKRLPQGERSLSGDQ